MEPEAGMKITTDIGDTHRILNNGRVIGDYVTATEFWGSLEILSRLQAQLARPEAFCNCEDKRILDRRMR
jgi:hypothetical protein